MRINLFFHQVVDQYVRDNFYRLIQYFQTQPLLNCDFKFFDIDISVTAPTNFTLAHGMDFIPLDIIVLSAIGDQNFYFINQIFDKTNIYISVGGSVRIRFLAGKYQDGN